MSPTPLKGRRPQQQQQHHQQQQRSPELQRSPASTQLFEPGCCRTPPPSSRRQRRAPRARARGIGAIKVNAAPRPSRARARNWRHKGQRRPLTVLPIFRSLFDDPVPRCARLPAPHHHHHRSPHRPSSIVSPVQCCFDRGGIKIDPVPRCARPAPPTTPANPAPRRPHQPPTRIQEVATAASRRRQRVGLLTNVAGKISKKNCRKRNWRSAAQPARAGRSDLGARRSAPPSHARTGNACQ